MTTYYISVTGFTLKSLIYLPRFTLYSIPAARQAAAAEGNVFSEQCYINGVLHTLSAWKDKKSMRKFMMSGAHAKAMKITREVGELSYGTKTYGYESDTIPSWEEAIKLWEDKGTLHGKLVPSRAPKSRTTIQTSNNLFGRKLFVQLFVACSAWFLLTNTSKILDPSMLPSMTSISF